MFLAHLFVFFFMLFGKCQNFTYLRTPIKNVGTFWFFDQYYNGKKRKDLHPRYTTQVTRNSRLRQAIWDADLFSRSYCKNSIQSINSKQCHMTILKTEKHLEIPSKQSILHSERCFWSRALDVHPTLYVNCKKLPIDSLNENKRTSLSLYGQSKK